MAAEEESKTLWTASIDRAARQGETLFKSNLNKHFSDGIVSDDD